MWLALLVTLVASQSCFDVLYNNPTLCSPRDSVYSSDNCTADCSTDECCRDWTCGAKVSSSNCPQPQVTNYSAICTTCDPAECCVDATSCWEIDASYCTLVDLVPTNLAGLCPGSCDRDRCCRPAESCSEYPGIQTICAQNRLVLNSSALCNASECQDPGLCCREAQICNEVTMTNWDFCYDANLAWNSSAYFVECGEGGCTTDICCMAPSNCQETRGTCPPGLIKDSSFRDCTNCANECCVPPQTCNELFAYVDSNVCYNLDLGPTTDSTLLTVSCGGNCTSDVCCVVTCNSVSSTLTCPRDKYFDYTAACTSCDAAECCRAINSCADVSATYNDACNQLGLYLDPNIPCNSSTCGTAVCCRAPTQCYEVPSSTCTAAGLVPNYAASCSQCDVAECCKPVESCNEAANLNVGMCSGLGQVRTGTSCSGDECNATVCCRPPETCREVESATSYDSSSLWCSQREFSNKFDQTICVGECTVGQCCLPNTCESWNQVSGDNFNICPLGTVFDGALQCDENGCSAETCCRAPTQCNETIFQYFCPAATHVTTAACSGNDCNVTTCCAPMTDCSQQNPLFCFAAGMIPNTTAGLCNGACTVSQCCRPPDNCGGVFACPSGTFNHYGACQGAQCSVDYCCISNQTCRDVPKSTFCKGYGFPKSDAVNCNGMCTKQQCCRSEPITCGEADVLTGLCHGAVDYFKPCQGAGCNANFCCRPALTCKEAIATGSVNCGPTGVPAHLNEVGCPSGSCDAANCCKPVANCGDQDVVLNGTLCSGSMVLDPAVTCGGITPCDSPTCCRTPVNCGEAKKLISCSGNTLFNEGAASSTCNPTCTAAQCCRKPASCGEAYYNNASLCGNLEFDLRIIPSPCVADDCAASCCIAVTFAPTTKAPGSAAPTTPTTAAPTRAPNSLTTAPTTQAPSGGGGNNTVSGSAAVSASMAMLAMLLCFA